MVDVGSRELIMWTIRSDRRLVTLRCFRYDHFLKVTDIATQTGRSIQNVSTALKELEKRGLVEQLDPGHRTWKKFGLTPLGKAVLADIERELGTGMFERMAGELSYRFVRDVYRLIVTHPIVATKDMKLHEVVDRILSDPRTRTAYVVDENGRLIGTIGVRQMLKAVEGSLNLLSKGNSRRGRSVRLPFSVQRYMSEAVAVREDDQLTDALKTMMKHNSEDLPVVDENGRLVGELNGLEILLLGSQIMRTSE